MIHTFSFHEIVISFSDQEKDLIVSFALQSYEP